MDDMSFAASIMGRAKSERKTAACKENGKRGGRPKGRKDTKPRKKRSPARDADQRPTPGAGLEPEGSA